MMLILNQHSHSRTFSLNEIKLDLGIKSDSEMKISDMYDLIDSYMNIISHHNKIIPDDEYQQLFDAIEAVFKSWNNARAVKYRIINNISHDLYTAVTVQSMVFGNMNNIVFIVFNDINAVIRMDYDEASGLLSKGSLPVGANVEVVLLATNSDYYYLGMETLTISENMSENISMTSMSLEDLIKEIRRLN